jgi:hypothetical protein
MAANETVTNMATPPYPRQCAATSPPSWASRAVQPLERDEGDGRAERTFSWVFRTAEVCLDHVLPLQLVRRAVHSVVRLYRSAAAVVQLTFFKRLI